MRLLELSNQKIDMLTEGGSLGGVGSIHIDEIEPTLTKLEKSVGVDLKNNVLGSVGKTQFSGDIDVALQIEPEAIPGFIERLKSNPDILDLSKSSVIMTKVQIVNYDPDKETDRPRTGYVQLDFMPGDPGWLKTYYHSPGDESKYKGVYRNILLATIAALFDMKNSDDETEDGRPLSSERFLFSPTEGLVKIIRTPVPKVSGEGYTKKNKNKIIDGPWKTPDDIAKILNLDSGSDLNSYETLKSAIEKNYPEDMVNKILGSFVDNRQIQDMGVPEDLLADQDIMNYMAKLGGNK